MLTAAASAVSQAAVLADIPPELPAWAYKVGKKPTTDSHWPEYMAKVRASTQAARERKVTLSSIFA